MNDTKRNEWSERTGISRASIDMIAFRLNRIGKLKALEDVLKFQEEQGVPVSAICLFIDNFEEVKPNELPPGRTSHWEDDDLAGIPHPKPTPYDFTKLLTR